MSETANTTHEHVWRFLRQEERNVGYDRNPTWQIEDVYFCEGCLEYGRVHVRTEEPSRELYAGNQRLVTWRKP